MAWHWVRDKWTWVVETFGGDKSYDDFVRYSASALLTRVELEQFSDFFTPMLNQPALTRTIELGIREVAGRVELIERDSLAVERAIDRHFDQLV